MSEGESVPPMLGSADEEGELVTFQVLMEPEPLAMGGVLKRNDKEGVGR